LHCWRDDGGAGGSRRGVLQRVFGWDRATSFFAVMPGALSLSLAMAADTRADLAKVSVVQVIRLFALVAVLPSLISGFSGTDAGSAVMPPAGSLKDVILVLGAGMVAGFIFDKLKVPAGLMLGPALASGIMHLTGVVHGVLPDWLLLPGFVFLGTMIGMRFAGVRPADIMSMAWRGAVGPGGRSGDQHHRRGGGVAPCGHSVFAHHAGVCTRRAGGHDHHGVCAQP
jgi:uncharacterized membrane protein AbrB (regulator of aidB expression)